MGLLDEAIREHLELKRLRGADPSEVVRKEQEALGPVVSGEDATSAEHEADSQGSSTASEDRALDGAKIHPDSDHARLSRETVELDMRAALEADACEHTVNSRPDTSSPTMSAAPSHARVGHSTSGSPTTGFSEWEWSDKRNPDFGRELRGEEPVYRPRILGTRETPAGDVRARVPGSLLDTA
jgi:hypothetical protein